MKIYYLLSFIFIYITFFLYILFKIQIKYIINFFLITLSIYFFQLHFDSTGAPGIGTFG